MLSGFQGLKPVLPLAGPHSYLLELFISSILAVTISLPIPGLSSCGLTFDTMVEKQLILTQPLLCLGTTAYFTPRWRKDGQKTVFEFRQVTEGTQAGSHSWFQTGIKN